MSIELTAIADDRLHRRLVVVLMRLGFRRHQAEDAASAAILYAFWRAKGGADARCREWGYLRTVAHNTARRYARRERREVSVSETIEVVSAFDPEADLFDQETRDALRQAIAQLPEEQRTLVTFCYLEGHTYKEAADTYGMPTGTVSLRLHSARKSLGHHLQAHGLDADNLV